MRTEHSYDLVMHGRNTEPTLLTPVVLAAPKSGVFTYMAEHCGEKLFVKLNTNDGVAEKEELRHRYFAHLPFVPSLRHAIHDPQQGRSILAYQFIPGVTLQEAFTQSRRDGNPIPVSVLSQAIAQSYEMREALEGRNDLSLDVPWAYASPLRVDQFPARKHEMFLSDYAPVFAANRAASVIFPGFYLDRNPRNIMINGSDVFHVDFGAIDKSSTIFDLAKLMRNGTDAPLDPQLPAGAIKAHPEIAWDLASVSPEAEDALLRFSYSLERDKLANFDTFSLLYQYAALHVHISYLTNYGKKLRLQRGDPDVVAARALYHAGMSINQLNRLKERGQQVDTLFPWIEMLVDQTDQYIPRQQ